MRAGRSSPWFRRARQVTPCHSQQPSRAGAAATHPGPRDSARVARNGTTAGRAGLVLAFEATAERPCWAH